jgi:hypothetical protein
MKFVNKKIMNALPGDANQVSDILDANQLLKISAQVIVAAQATGSVQLQVSNDVCAYGGATANQFAPTNWSNLGSPVSITAAGVSLVAQQDLCYRWLRAIYTDGSAGAEDGAITVQIMALSV